MSESWKDWEGQTIDGKFPLITFAGESEQSVVFLTERQADGATMPAAIKMVPAGSDRGERQLEKWRQAAKLSHPHLIPLYEMGYCEMGGIAALYLVMARAEENLAQILSVRALDADEARAALDSVVDVLAYLHAKGFVHGRIKPSNIMASGDDVKVSSDALSRADDSIDRRRDTDAYEPPEYMPGEIASHQTMTPSGDIWSLGMTLVEALTRVLPVARIDQQQDPQVPQTLPNPFLDIAKHCLVRHPQGRWTAAQIADCLQGRMAVTAPPCAHPVNREASVPAHPPQATTPIQPQLKHGMDEPPRRYAKRRTSPVLVAFGLAALLAVVVFGIRFFRGSSQPASAPAASYEQPAIPVAHPAAPAAKLEAEPPKHHDNPEPAFTDDDANSKAPVPTSASIESARLPEVESSPVTNLATASSMRGMIAHQAMPEVLPAARKSIRGTVRVIVKLSVDRKGNVKDAELAARGPSKYFARQALQASQSWKFKPPRVAGQDVLSTWTLQYEFTRDGSKVIPRQEMP